MLRLGGKGDYFRLIKFPTSDPAQEKSCSQGKALHQHRLTTRPSFHGGKTGDFNPDSKTSQKLVSAVIAQAKEGLGDSLYFPPHTHLFLFFIFFCIESEELFLGLCGLRQDAVPHFQSVFPGANRPHRAQPRVITCCMFPNPGTKGEDFLFFLGCGSHVTLLRVQCEWDFKTDFNQVPSRAFSFNRKKVFHRYQKREKCAFASYARDRELSPIIKGGVRKNRLTFQGRFLPRAGNVIPHSSKPVQHWSLPVKYQKAGVNLVS